MKLRLVMADPAGNRTAIVLTPVPRERRAPLSRALMALPELRAEQVGFACPPKGRDALGRLAMMGGEFCGNAARSFGLLLAAERGPGPRTVPIEISGCREVLWVEARPESRFSASPMPLPRAFDRLSVPELSPKALPAVLLPGITHVIVREAAPSPAAFRAVQQAAAARWDWEALGVLFLSPRGELTPAVAVRATGTAVFESSCASGSTALALWLARDLAQGERTFPIPQPGGTLTVRVAKEGGQITALTVGGPVVLEPPREAEIEEERP